MLKSIFCILLSLSFGFSAQADKPKLPLAPTDSAHPGSKIYDHNFTRTALNCRQREIVAFIPDGTGPFPLVIFGHGQALDDSNYAGTFTHLAKKGVAVIHPQYDSGFFDQNWVRMAEDYVDLAQCFLDQNRNLIDTQKVVFSGHSKGAYVASIAAGLAFEKKKSLLPASVVLLNPAGALTDKFKFMSPDVELTVVFSDQDSIVEKDFSQKIYDAAPSLKKQFILLRSYEAKDVSTKLAAGHMWCLTKATFFGGGGESAFHYYGMWKWLVGATLDFNEGSQGTNRFLYGADSLDKGLPGLEDTAQRNF